MKRHLNTLYVLTQGSYLSKTGETVSIRVDDEETLRIPILNLEGIVCFGNVLCSPFLLGLCGDRGVAVAFLSRRGRFLGRVHGATSGNVLLRRGQYRRADARDHALEIARNIVVGKLANCRTVVLRSLRDHPQEAEEDARSRAVVALARHVESAREARDLDQLRGVEGGGAREYFGCFDALIRTHSNEFRFDGRSRRPPRDRVNAVLSFVYTLLVNDLTGAVEGVGLDPQVGFLHRDRPGRPSLALDLMEELRPFLADRLALSLINRGQLAPRDFVERPDGGVWLRERGRKVVIKTYQERKEDTLTHPYLEEKTTVGMLAHLQALLMARHIRGDLDGYPPFLNK